MAAYTLAAGTTIAGYRIDGVIGRGGMGAVYQATQLSLDRTVALKVIAADLSEDNEFRERFRREGRIQARIDHPHIIPIYEAGESEHGLFLAMRLVQGSNLYELAATGDLDVPRVMRLLAQAAGALDAAHEVGLIHRDVKPHNILVERRRTEHAYLGDFGITKARGQTKLTKSGLLVGTIDYMSPEQILGRGAIEASDVYAFGCVLYESLTGSVPFPKPENVAVMYAHVSEAPPLVSARRSDLPAEIDEVVQRALAKEPKERYESATDLIIAAEAALGIPSYAARALKPPTPAHPRPVPPEIAAVTPVPSRAPTTLTDDDTDRSVAPPTVLHPPTAPQEPATPAPAPAGPTLVPDRVTPAPGPTLVPAAAESSAVVPTALTPTDQPVVPAERESDPAMPTVLAPTDQPVAPTVAPAERESDPGMPTVLAPTDQPVAPPVAPAERESDPAMPTVLAPTDEPERPTVSVVPAVTAPVVAAEVAEAPVPPPTTRRTYQTPARGTPIPGGGRVLAVVLAASLVALAIGGFVLGRSSSGEAGAQQTPSTRTVPAEPVSADGVELALPAGWAAAESPEVAGVALTNGIAAESEDASLAVGRVAKPTWPSYLPAGIRDRLSADALGAPEHVTVDGADGLRYGDVTLRGVDGRTTLVTLPQDGYTTLLACRSADADQLADCEKLAGSVSLSDREPYALTPPKAWVSALGGTVAALNRARTTGARDLRRATTVPAQARAARATAAACRSQLGKLRRAQTSPHVAPAHAGVVEALAATCASWTRLAAAAKPGAAARFNAAKRRLASDETKLSDALGRLRTVGVGR